MKIIISWNFNDRINFIESILSGTNSNNFRDLPLKVPTVTCAILYFRN